MTPSDSDYTFYSLQVFLLSHDGGVTLRSHQPKWNLLVYDGGVSVCSHQPSCNLPLVDDVCLSWRFSWNNRINGEKDCRRRIFMNGLKWVQRGGGGLVRWFAPVLVVDFEERNLPDLRLWLQQPACSQQMPGGVEGWDNGMSGGLEVWGGRSLWSTGAGVGAERRLKQVFGYRTGDENGRLSLEEEREWWRPAVGLPASLAGIQFPLNHYNKERAQKRLQLNQVEHQK